MARRVMLQVLLAAVDSTDGEIIIGALGPGVHCTSVGTRSEYRKNLASGQHDMVFVDVGTLGLECGDIEAHREFIREAWTANPDIEIVVMDLQKRTRLLVNLVKAGASDFITTPVNTDVLEHVLDNLRLKRQVKSQIRYYSDNGLASEMKDFMARCSPAMQDVFEKIRAVADTRALVLLFGETGVGKSWLARVVHNLSNRADGPFISVHCGSVPESLFESELFGHERGSFTSADRRQIGKLELGRRGSLFLDEVGTMTPTQQVKLLHVLQEKTFQRIGGRKDIPLETRIIAATNADLKERVGMGGFRKDLFFRLNIFPVTIPPLRERPDDIKLLVEHFLKVFRDRHGRDVQGIHPVALEAILRYEWPGNVRELENILERSYILESSRIIRPETLPLELSCTFTPHNGNCIDTSHPLSDLKQRAVDTIERLYILKLFEQHDGRMDKTARHAGISTRHLRNLIRKHGIDRVEYKRRSG